MASFNYSSLYSCYDGRGLSSNSVTVDYWDTSGGDLRPPALASAILTFSFILVGIPSNILILVSILWKHLYREPTYVLLLNLAIANLLMCILVMPFTVISGFAGGFIFGTTDWTRCRVCQSAFAQIGLALFDIHILALISVDRYIFVKYPFKYYSVVSIRRVVILTLGLWVFCVLMSLCPLFGFGDIHYGLTISTCKIRFDSSTTVTKNIYYGVFVAVESLVIPLPVLFFTNISVVWTAQKHLRKMYATKKEVGCSHEEVVVKILKDFERTKYKKQIQLIKVFGGILLGHVFTWLPVIIYIFRVATLGHDEFTAPDDVFAYITYIFFPVLHPILEAYLIPEVRNILVDIISFCACGCKCWSLPKKCSENGQFTITCKPHTLKAAYGCNKIKQYLDLFCLAALPIENETDLTQNVLV